MASRSCRCWRCDWGARPRSSTSTRSPSSTGCRAATAHLRVGATVRQRQVQYDDAAARRAAAAARAALGRPPGDPQPRDRLRQHRARRPVGRAARGRLAAWTPPWWSPAPRASAEIPASEFFTGAMSTVDPARGAPDRGPVPGGRGRRGLRVRRVRPPARRLRPGRRRGPRAHHRRRAPDARISCFGISDHPVTRDVSQQLRAALDATGADPDESDLRRALADHADGIADDVVDTGGDAHAQRGVPPPADRRPGLPPGRPGLPEGRPIHPRGGVLVSLPNAYARTEADETVDVTMTVNGSEVTLSLPARVTLVRRAARPPRPDRHPRRVRARHLRDVHHPRRRPGLPRLPAVRRSSSTAPRSSRSKASAARTTCTRCRSRSASTTPSSAASARPVS